MSAGTEDHAANIDPAKLELLLQQYGIEREFIQFSGVIAHIPLPNRLHILDTMGIAVDSPEQVDCLLGGPQYPLPLGTMDEARPVCNACTARSVWREDED